MCLTLNLFTGIPYRTAKIDKNGRSTDELKNFVNTSVFLDVDIFFIYITRQISSNCRVGLTIILITNYGKTT